MIQLRDSSQGSHEVGFSVYDSSGYHKVFPGYPNNNPPYPAVFIGTQYGVSTFMTSPTKTISAMVHLHEKGIDPLPDIVDVYNVILARDSVGLPSYSNPNFKNSFIVCGDTAIDLDIAITDTVAARAFMRNYPRDSIVRKDANGNLIGNGWSQNFIPPGKNLSLSRDFNNARDALISQNYPYKLANTYAQVYMMQKYNMGTTILMKVNGQFKQLTASNITYDTNGKLQTITTNICP